MLLVAGMFDCMLSMELISSSLEARSLKASSSHSSCGFSSVSQIASMFDCVRDVFLNKTLNILCCCWCLGDGKRESQFNVSPGFPVG